MRECAVLSCKFSLFGLVWLDSLTLCRRLIAVLSAVSDGGRGVRQCHARKAGPQGRVWPQDDRRRRQEEEEEEEQGAHALNIYV